ncbi:MAG: hypothetical protein HQL40_15805 [Alphaproteobacteria bacterium]|nr:hypothetical protein [Alphaproteobacteria bacterium]
MAKLLLMAATCMTFIGFSAQAQSFFVETPFMRLAPEVVQPRGFGGATGARPLPNVRPQIERTYNRPQIEQALKNPVPQRVAPRTEIGNTLRQAPLNSTSKPSGQGDCIRAQYNGPCTLY